MARIKYSAIHDQARQLRQDWINGRKREVADAILKRHGHIRTLLIIDLFEQLQAPRKQGDTFITHHNEFANFIYAITFNETTGEHDNA